VLPSVEQIEQHPILDPKSGKIGIGEIDYQAGFCITGR
jgi:hypothetical protein